MDFLKIVQNYKDEMVTKLKELLQIPSVRNEQDATPEAPFGKEVKRSLDYTLQLGKELGFAVENVDNVAGHIEYGEGDEILGVLTHLDVVPVGEGWTYPPFSATEIDGKIYARGAIDDKGPTISVIYALKILKDLQVVPNKKVRIIIGTDEESGWGCVKKYFAKFPMPTIGFSPDANFPLIYGEKGILSLELSGNFESDLIKTFNAGLRLNVVPDYARAIITKDLEKEYQEFLNKNQLKGEFKKIDNGYEIIMHGISAHAMHPEKGKNAGIWLAKFLTQFDYNPQLSFLANSLDDTRFRTINLNFTDPEMGDLTFNVGIIEINENKIAYKLNLRYPINWDKQTFLTKLSQLAQNNKLELKVISDNNPHYVNPNDDLVKTLHSAYIKYTNDIETPLLTIGGGTYARALQKGVAFGIVFPGRKDVVHQVDEYIIIDDLLVATAIYVQAIYDLVK